MATDSSAAGYLVPAGTPNPIYDQALDRVLHDVIQGITGIVDPTLVRPRWQPEPPATPAFTTDWIAYGITRSTRDTFAYMGHDGDGQGSDELVRTEELLVLVSTYGPNAHGNMERLSDGFEVEQNRAALQALDADLVECQESIVLPALLKEKWVKRVDMTIVLRRKVTRSYPVLNLQSADLDSLDNEQYITNLHTP